MTVIAAPGRVVDTEYPFIIKCWQYAMLPGNAGLSSGHFHGHGNCSVEDWHCSYAAALAAECCVTILASLLIIQLSCSNNSNYIYDTVTLPFSGVISSLKHCNVSY